MNAILSYVFFVFAIANYVGAMCQKTRKGLLFFIVVADICFALYYLFLERFAPVFFNVFEAILMLFLYLIEKHNKSFKYVIFAVTITWSADLLSLILTWTGPLQLLSFTASSMFFMGLLLRRLVFTKGFDVVSITCATIYWFCVSGIFTGIAGVLLFVGSIYGFVKTLVFEFKKKELQRTHAKTVEQKTVKKLPNSQIQTEKTA